MRATGAARRFLLTNASLLIAGLAAVPCASAQSSAPATTTLPRWARVSFFAQGSTTTPVEGESSSFSEFVTTIATESTRREDGGFEYGFDGRFGAYPSAEDRDPRVSIYDAYIAQRFAGGRLLVKGGQMWLNDLGGLGSVGGGLVEYRKSPGSKGLRWRFGAFGGVEPKILQAGYASGIKKFGGYAAFEGNGAQKHVVGYVNVRNGNLTERSVLTFTNYVPVKQSFFLYQAAEFDLSGPGGQGNGGLTYFFANARVAPSRVFDVQLTYHRGRSIDARTITDDLLHGRPVAPKSLEGYLYQSANARVTVEVFKGFRVFAGYGQDKNDSSDAAVDRITFGVFSSNLFGTGLDLNVSDYRYNRPEGSSYDSWYVSVGRSVGSKLYLSGDYSTSLSILRYTQSNGITIENRPQTQRFGGSALVHLTRSMSLVLNVDHTRDDAYTEFRFMAGLTYRF